MSDALDFVVWNVGPDRDPHAILALALQLGLLRRDGDTIYTRPAVA